jgi:hypothetical protein
MQKKRPQHLKIRQRDQLASLPFCLKNVLACLRRSSFHQEIVTRAGKFRNMTDAITIDSSDSY